MAINYYLQFNNSKVVVIYSFFGENLKETKIIIKFLKLLSKNVAPLQELSIWNLAHWRTKSSHLVGSHTKERYNLTDHEKIVLFHENILSREHYLKQFTIKKSTCAQRVKITEIFKISFGQFTCSKFKNDLRMI